MGAGILAVGLFLAQIPPTSPASPVPSQPAPSISSLSAAVPPQLSAAYTIKDAASNGLSLLALGVALYSLRRNIAQGQRTQLLTRLQRSIKELDEKSVALIETLEKNLLGELDAHRKCALGWKALQTLVKDLELHVPCCGEEIFRVVHNWQQVAMGDPYPVQIANRALKPDSAHLDKVRAAQEALHSYLIKLEDGCILGEVKYWKRTKKTRTAPAGI